MKTRNFLNSSITPKNVFEVLNENNIKQTYGNEIFDLCLWLVTLISIESNKKKKECIPLFSVFLRSICSHHDKTVIKILIDLKIIRRSLEASYIDKKCSEYSINKEFCSSKNNKLIPRFYRSDLVVKRILRNNKNDILKNKLNKELEKNFLYKMAIEKTSFDYDSALEYINFTYIDSSIEYKTRFEILNYINEGFLWAHFARNCNRFYSTFTNLPSDLRKFILIDNIKSDKVYFDICNSQIQLLMHEVLSKNAILFEKKDAVKFFELVKNNDKDFYSEMITILGVNETRDTIKPMFSNLLYNINTRIASKAYDENLREFYLSFKKSFPTIWKFIYTKKLNKKACSDFATILMNVESDFILNKVAKRLYKDKITVITIHDGFLVNTEYESVAEKYFIEESMEYFGNIIKYKKEEI